MDNLFTQSGTEQVRGCGEVSIPSRETAIKRPDPHTLNYSRAAQGSVYPVSQPAITNPSTEA